MVFCVLDFLCHFNYWIFLKMGHFSFYGNIFSDKCCTVAVSWWIPSLVKFSNFSTSTFFISNLLVPVPRVIKMQICTASFKSTIYWNFESFTTLGCFFSGKIWLSLYNCNVPDFQDDKLNPPFSEASELRKKFHQ